MRTLTVSGKVIQVVESNTQLLQSSPNSCFFRSSQECFWTESFWTKVFYLCFIDVTNDPYDLSWENLIAVTGKCLRHNTLGALEMIIMAELISHIQLYMRHPQSLTKYLRQTLVFM